MPRIRTLKPEHRQHRKVGPLSHADYRLWVGMILEADDEGRLVCDARQLGALIFGYHQDVTPVLIEDSLRTLATLRLIRLYVHNGTRYADFPSWGDHQRINRPTPSKLPPYDDSLSIHGGLQDDSLLIGREGKGKELKPPPPSPSSLQKRGNGQPSSWPSPEALAELWNVTVPPGHPRVKPEEVLGKRREKALRALRQFPDQTWWVATFAEIGRAPLLLGRRPSPGHETFRGDFSWVLSAGKDGIENFVKVHEGRYRDEEESYGLER